MRGDARLVAALKQREREAFSQLVTAYENAVRGVAYGLVRNREDARDIAQEVFLRAYLQIPKLDGEVHLWAWLYRVTVNASWDHLRARSRRPPLAREGLEQVDSQATDDLARAELAELFGASLQRLPPMQQAALLLRDVHGLRHGEIAATLGISRGSSEVLLFRARRSFRAAFRAMTQADAPARACDYAERAAASSAGGRLTDGRSRRVLEHAKQCPSCRRTVQRWGGSRVLGLGLALPHLVPDDVVEPAGAVAATGLVGAAGSSALGSAAASSAPLASSVGSAASTSLAPSAASLSAIVGDLAAKVAAVGLAKVAAVTVAATVLTTGGVAAVHDGAHKARRPATQAAVAATVVPGAGQAGGVVQDEAVTTAARPALRSGPAGRGAPSDGSAGETTVTGASNRSLTWAATDVSPAQREGVLRQLAAGNAVVGAVSGRRRDSRRAFTARWARRAAAAQRAGWRDAGLSSADGAPQLARRIAADRDQAKAGGGRGTADRQEVKARTSREAVGIPVKAVGSASARPRQAVEARLVKSPRVRTAKPQTARRAVTELHDHRPD